MPDVRSNIRRPNMVCHLGHFFPTGRHRTVRLCRFSLTARCERDGALSPRVANDDTAADKRSRALANTPVVWHG
eukprot:2962358-Pyramimonas_sp.AAC.2